MDGIKSIEDKREWTVLHKEVADSRHLGLTPPQTGIPDGRYDYRNVDVRGPGGLTPLHVAVCRVGGNYDSYHEDDKDSDDSGDGVVSIFKRNSLVLNLLPSPRCFGFVTESSSLFFSLGKILLLRNQISLIFDSPDFL